MLSICSLHTSHNPCFQQRIEAIHHKGTAAATLKAVDARKSRSAISGQKSKISAQQQHLILIGFYPPI